MEAAKKRHIKSGAEYDHLFPKAEVGTQTIIHDAGVSDTVAFIPKVVHRTLDQTKALAASLQGRSLHETCRNIWEFVYGHIAYRKDKEGYEQIRSPARAWHDRRSGIDCDCYSTFISSILTNLGIPHLLRITKYGRDYFQHIYPVVRSGGKEIILDCVTDSFDYEVPYSQKKDYPMELQYLNGIDTLYNGDTILAGAGDGMAELGRIVRKKMAQGSAPKAPSKPFQKAAGRGAAKSAAPGAPAAKKPKGLKKVLNVVNKVNPATVLLRNGILAAMKLNVGKLASRLRWSYLPADKAKAKGIDPAKFSKLMEVRKKLENIFYGAGGKTDNLRKAILTGKGNSNKAVSGLGFLGHDDAVAYATIHTPLHQLLGSDIFHSENIEGMNGLGALGEPVTLATVTAASGVIAAIAGLLKKVGDIFGGKGEGAGDFSEGAVTTADAEAQAATTSNEAALTVATAPGADAGAGTSTAVTTTGGDAGGEGAQSGDGNPITSMARSTDPSGEGGGSNTPAAASGKSDGDEEGFWAKNKKWLLPVSIGVGGLTILAVGMSAMKKPAPGRAMHGVPARKAYRRKAQPKRKGRAKTTHTKKTSVVLL